MSGTLNKSPLIKHNWKLKEAFQIIDLDGEKGN